MAENRCSLIKSIVFKIKKFGCLKSFRIFSVSCKHVLSKLCFSKFTKNQIWQNRFFCSFNLNFLFVFIKLLKIICSQKSKTLYFINFFVYKFIIYLAVSDHFILYITFIHLNSYIFYFDVNLKHYFFWKQEVLSKWVFCKL